MKPKTDVTIKDAVDLMLSGGIKNRTDGVSDLKSIFRHNQRAIEALDDAGYHSILEALFQVATLEKHAYLAAKNAAQKSKTEAALASCSDLLHTAIRAGADKLTPKTVIAVIEHVTQLLPVAGGEYCAGLSSFYLKTLGSLFEYQAHVEQLKLGDWLSIVDFCLEGIAEYQSDSSWQTPTSSRKASNGATASSHQAPSSSTKPSMRSISDGGSAVSTAKRNSDELLHCLLHLISPANAPILERAEALYEGILRFLESRDSSISFVHQVAFSAMNLLLSSTSADRTALTQAAAVRLIPLVSRLWSSRAGGSSKDEMLNSVKDEMLVTLLLLRHWMERMMRVPSLGELRLQLVDLEEVLRLDYSRRLEPQQLQLEDLDMGSSAIEAPFESCIFAGDHILKSSTARAERSWAVLYVLALLNRLLTLENGRTAIDDGEADDEASIHPRKRRRLVQRLDTLSSALNSQNEAQQVAALHILLFLLPEQRLDVSELSDLLQNLSLRVPSRQRNIGAWALMCIASCTFQTTAKEIVRTFSWVQLWHTAARMVTTTASCRAACYLLHSIIGNGLVSYQDIAEDINAMITAPEASAPATLTDSSTSLMVHLLNLRNMQIPGGSVAACHHVIRWASAKWNPMDKRYIAQSPVDVQAVDILNLMRSILGLSLVYVPLPRYATRGSIGQAWAHDKQNEQLIHYLLLLENVPRTVAHCVKCVGTRDLHEPDRVAIASSHGPQAKRLILELFTPKFEALVEDWQAQLAEDSTQVSNDAVRSTASAVILGCLLMSLVLPSQLGPTQDQLVRALRQLQELVILRLRRNNHAHDLVETIVYTIQQYLPLIQTVQLKHLGQANPLLLEFFLVVADLPALRLSASASVADGAMDLDLFEAQTTHRKGPDSRTSSARKAHGMALSANAFYQATAAHISLLAKIFRSQGSADKIPKSFADYVAQMSPHETLLCRSLLRDALRSDLVVDESVFSAFIDHIASILELPDYACCEVAQLLCIDTLTSVVPIWIHPAEDGGTIVAKKLYEWFIRRVLPKRRPSTAVQVALASLCFEIIRQQPAHDEDSQSPSARSCLLDILLDGPMGVKFHIGELLPDLFGLYVSKRHTDILFDVRESLPSNLEWGEGIALRLRVLSSLAAKWPSLIRLCIYYILEASGRSPESVEHASYCLTNVSRTLGLENSRDLFHLFASQLLYTWLESEKLDNVPFQIFGYSTLRHLVDCNLEEIAGLMIMRGQDHSLDETARLAEMPYEELLQRCFGKIMAYSIAHDISVPPSNSAEKHVSGEARIRKRLSKDVFLKLITQHFAAIIALFFTLIDQEENIVDKSFLKDERFFAAAEAMREIKSIGSSEVLLPPNQQPAFKARYLTSEIEHLCGRTDYDVASLFTPSLFVFIAREIVKTIHPALGSLHACAGLRKLRVLVAMAGPAGVQGYPLEMLLRAITPFIVDTECANDAIGLTQYLLSRGSAYLSVSASFVTGISLAISASLRAFLEASPSSTTQQSQYRSTLSKAQSFQTWLRSYLDKYEPTVLDGDGKAAIRVILKSALMFHSGGTPELETAEGELLLAILEDERSGRLLLDKSTRNYTISTLYGDFKQTRSFRSDVLGSDDRAAAYANTLWNICQEASVARPFRVWAAKVLGRAFVATGRLHDELIRESGFEPLTASAYGPGHSRSSKSALLHQLQMLLLDNHPRTVGLAEAVLRIIVTRSRSTDRADAGISPEDLSASIYTVSDWGSYHAPPSDTNVLQTGLPHNPYGSDAILEPTWAQRLAIAVVQSVPSEVVLSALQRPLEDIVGFAEQTFPYLVHLVLSLQMDGPQPVKRQLSKALKVWLEMQVPNANHVKLILDTLLYLRTQVLPREKSSADRMHWLEVDYSSAAQAAVRCGMYKTGLLFTEISISETSRSSRRSSISKPVESHDILLSIFKSIGDPDIFYGVQQNASLDTVLERLEHEHDGLKSLAFRGARYDSSLRREQRSSLSDAHALVNALSTLSLDGLAHSVLQSQQGANLDMVSTRRMFETARKLEQWDLPMPAIYDDDAVTVYKTFQAINLAEDRPSVIKIIETGLESTMLALVKATSRATVAHTLLPSLAALTELDEVMSASSSEEFEEMLDRFQRRARWMETGRFDGVNTIMSCRETLLGIIGKQPELRNILNVSPSDVRLVEAQAALLSSKLSRSHGALQESLRTATYLTGLIEPNQALGIHIEAAVHLETANALWEQGEMTASIGMLQALEKGTALKKQTIAVGRSDLLAKLGYQVSVARLEKPDSIVEKYLYPALKELKGKAHGHEAGHVFHEFAVFCDQQLEDADGQEDLVRLKKLKEMKSSEVNELVRMVKSATSTEQKARYQAHLVKAKQWLQLDTEEYRRLSSSKDELLRQSLENYLLSLTASDGHNNDALRFTALWLEHSDEPMAVESVAKYLSKVPTRKFAALINQLTSRLLDSAKDQFQELLFSLVLRICVDHPFHGMYQIWAGFRSKSNTRDETAVSRQAATSRLAQQLTTIPKSAKIWSAVHKTNTLYCQLAAERDESRYKAGQKIQLKDSAAGSLLNNMLPRCPIPPPTLQVDIAPDLDYSNVPVMSTLEPQISIASGVSAPKIITVRASNGAKFKQLVKGGNDDLRQDAIMEQVFAQVNELLKANTATRQRNLGIRTYKVLPLTSNAGIIEFVSDTVPLHEFLMPAHERYYPKDLKGSQCRKQIGDVQTQKFEVRLKTYRNVTDQFHPVMRYFFMEKFHDPDEWFAKRTAYSRSTAAISVLGHVLGLGDRHGHNILLDEKTGEVVHIDLGVAFEMGRVLPVPELVPFRLTRDIVDGMGITGTEGVFRRCCEFTLEALRKESYSIMTILDVLRYDPLYSWSISPVRLAKLQEAQSAAPAYSAGGEMVSSRRPRDTTNEPSEAERALTVVKKKLSKTLSVTATVNDLINQASDEKNLAVLYSGWAAYA